MGCLRYVLPVLLASAGTLLGVDARNSLESARRLSDAGRLEDAERLVRASLQSVGDAATHTALGDILFRRADFENAMAAYRTALSADPNHARAWWGLGRIELAQFRRTRARMLFSRAYGINPRDPDIIRSYADFTTDPPSRATLLRNVVLLTRNSDLRRAEDSLAQLELELRLKGTRPARLVSPYQDYSIRLSPFLPVNQKVAGLLVPVRINGGKTLHLLLDTGAHGISIPARYARPLGLEAISESRIVGLGGAGPTDATVTLAESVAFGDLVLGNCVVEVTREPLTRGADGVIGMDLFEAFEIRLDARAMTLGLTPFPDRRPAWEITEGGLSPWISWDRGTNSVSSDAYGFGHFLLLKATVNNREGLFLVDTGSAVTSLAHEFAPPGIRNFDGPSLQGAAGNVSDAYRISPVAMQFAGKKYFENEPVALNLSDLNARLGVRVSGILGFPALSHAPVTINYRDGLIAIAAR